MDAIGYRRDIFRDVPYSYPNLPYQFQFFTSLPPDSVGWWTGGHPRSTWTGVSGTIVLI